VEGRCMYIRCSPNSDYMVIMPYRVTTPAYLFLYPLFKELGLKQHFYCQ